MAATVTEIPYIMWLWYMYMDSNV